MDRIKNINSFYPFTINSFEFSNELPVLDKKLSPEENLFKELQSLSDCDLIVLDTFSVFFSFFGFIKDQSSQKNPSNQQEYDIYKERLNSKLSTICVGSKEYDKFERELRVRNKAK